MLDLNDLLTLSGATVTANRVVADSPHIVHESYFKPVESCRLGDVMKYYMDVDTKSAIVASCDEISMTVTKKFGTGMCEQDDGYTILENGVETSRCGAPVDANFFIVESNGTRRTLTSDEICVNLGGGCLNSNANKAFSIPMDGIAQRVLKLSAKTGSSVGELTNIQMQFTSKLDPLSQFDKTYNGRLDLLFGPYSFIQSTPIFSFKFDTTDVANIIAGKPLHGILMALKASEDESDSASQCETPYDNQTLILNFDTLWADNTSTTDEALTYSVDKGPLLPLPSDKIVTAETDTTGLNLGPNQVQVTFDEKSQVALSFLVEDAGAAKLDITNTKSDTIDNSDGSHNDICPDDQTANCQVTAKGLLHLYSRPYTFAICDGEEGPKYGQELPFATESAGLFSAAHFAMAGQTFKTMIKPVAWREGDPDLDPLTGQLVIGTEPAEDPNDPAIDLLDGNLSWVTMSDLCGRPALNGFFTNSPRGPYTSMVEINGVPELLMPLEGQSISINGDRSLLNNDPSRVNFSENVAITTHIATDVGIVKWDVVDNDYFGMTINPATLNLGRFDPSHFTIASKSYEHDSTSNGCVRNSNVGHSVSLEASLPIELTDYTCSFLGSGLRNDFTYLGQDFMINYEIRPMAEGMLARNYQYFDDNLKATFKLHVLKNGAIDNSVEAQTLYTLLNETAGWNDGVYTTDYNKVDPLFDPDTENPLLPHHLKSRATLPRQKQSALMNVQIAVEKQEPSGTNNIPFTNEVTTINGSQYSLLDNTLTLLYGEFRVLSHQGHQNYLPLPMVMGAYYFDSSTIADGHDGFVLNSQDNLRYGSFEDLTYQVTRTPGNAAIGPILNNGSLFSWVDHDSNQLFDFNNQVVQPTLNHHSAQPMYDSNGQLSIANINGDLVDSIQFQLTDGLAKRSSYLTKESHLFYAIYDTGAPEAVSEMGFRLNNFDQIYPWLASSPPVATFPFGKAKNKNRATDGKILFRSLRY